MDLDTRRLDLVDCGHTRTILLRRRSGICEYLQGKNLPLGVIEGETYQQVTTSIDDGDVLLFYSDGVTETLDAAGNAFGLAYISSPIALMKYITCAMTKGETAFPANSPASPARSAYSL
jgi:hypothetical protein